MDLIIGLIIGVVAGGFAVALYLSLTHPNWENEIYAEGYLAGYERRKEDNS